MFRILAALLFLSLPLTAQEVSDLSPRDGWAVHSTDLDFDTLVERTGAAVADNGMAIVTRAGPTGAAANRGITIPGNMVIGVFNNDFAVRILRLSTPAMIHAPVRLYVTENADGTATLSYIRPSTLLAPYVGEAGVELSDAASELDGIFAAIAETAATR
ncbi:DUF302 domain-containing protein [Hasllibacter sp. MH4015]|uniref:DUF302 domain-containing protein n=1 Tax=Hasllibacter sp. MH4015 TaxID=2854029 RepID=UPI001CD7BC35|nr:DUF302 domain-containing protein [Hasllibacter sp. MH4015]